MNHLAVVGLAVLSISSFGAVIKVDCEFYSRASNMDDLSNGKKVSVEINTGRSLDKDPTEIKEVTKAGTFDISVSEAGALSVRVSSAGKPIVNGLWQTVKNLDNNHGITGLQYVNLPTGAELQYFCKAR